MSVVFPGKPGPPGWGLTAGGGAAEEIVEAIQGNRFCVVVGLDAGAMDLRYRPSPRMAADLVYRFMSSLLAA